jgi:hypothetical protein
MFRFGALCWLSWSCLVPIARAESPLGDAALDWGDGAPPAEWEQRYQEREAALLAQAKQLAPDRYQQLMKMRDTQPIAYIFALQRTARLLSQADDPRMGGARVIELEVQLTEMAVGFDALPAGEQARRRAEMEDIAGEVFDLRQEQRRIRLHDMERRLGTLTSDIGDREKRRQQLVEEYLDELIEASAPAAP